MSDAEKDKQSAKAFYDLMFNQSRPAEAIERYVGDEGTARSSSTGTVLQVVSQTANDNTMF